MFVAASNATAAPAPLVPTTLVTLIPTTAGSNASIAALIAQKGGHFRYFSFFLKLTDTNAFGHF